MFFYITVEYSISLNEKIDYHSSANSIYYSFLYIWVKVDLQSYIIFVKHKQMSNYILLAIPVNENILKFVTKTLY